MRLVIAKAPTAGFLSRITVERSALDVYNAQVQPAGPPPTMATSHSITSMCKAEGDDAVGTDLCGRLADGFSMKPHAPWRKRTAAKNLISLESVLLMKCIGVQAFKHRVSKDIDALVQISLVC